MKKSLIFALSGVLFIVIAVINCGRVSSNDAANGSTTTTVTTTTTTTSTTTTTTIRGTPVDLSIFTHYVTDETQDQSNFPDGATYFDETDVARVSSAVAADKIYIYLEVAGTFELEAQLAENGTAEVHERAINVGLDLDNDTATGWASSGMDLQGTYKTTATYSSETAYWGVYQYNEDDTHVINRYNTLIHNGGIGYNYVVFSVPLSAEAYLGVDLAKGSSIKILGWGEAAAGYKEDGTELYHDYAFDALGGSANTGTESVLGGE